MKWAFAKALKTTAATFRQKEASRRTHADGLSAQKMRLCLSAKPVTVTQIGGMYKGDASRTKQNLVDYGFRLPSARDNRPLKFPEFERIMPQTVFVSATPAKYEEEHAGQVVEQVVRPTTGRPAYRNPPRRHPGGRFAQRNQHPQRKRRARARHHPHQTHGRAAHRLLQRIGRESALSAQRHRHRRARGNHPRLALRAV